MSLYPGHMGPWVTKFICNTLNHNVVLLAAILEIIVASKALTVLIANSKVITDKFEYKISSS